MDIAGRLRSLRELKALSQGDIEERTGLLRCYISRVENGHTVPAIETLEKMARALDVPMYQLFYGAEVSSGEPDSGTKTVDWASQGKGARTFRKFRSAASQMTVEDRDLLLKMAGEVVRAKRERRPRSKS